MTIDIETQHIADVKAGAWDAWMARHGAADFQHYYGYGAAMAQPATTAIFLRFVEAGVDVARGLFMQQKFGPVTLTYVPRGLVLATPEAGAAAYQALRAMACAWKGKVILFSPSTDMAPNVADVSPIISGESEAVLSLGSTIDVVIASMHQKWRNRLHKAQDAGLDIHIEHTPGANATWIVGEELAQRKRKGYHALPADLPCKMAQAKGKAGSLSVTASRQGRYLAGANFILSGHSATYFSGITLPGGRDLCAQYLVLVSAAQTLINDGYKTFILGGLDTHRAAGLARFKLGIGARKYTRMGTFLLV